MNAEQQEQADPEIAAAQARVEAALAEFNQLNAVMPQGRQFMLPPMPMMEMTATLDVLVAAVIGAGIIEDQRAFAIVRTAHLAEIIESLAEQARAAKRQMTGLIVPGAGMPQG